MESKPAQNIQDTFLNTARKERTNITIYLLSGVKLTGRIRSFDKYSCGSGNGQPGAVDLQTRDFDDCHGKRCAWVRGTIRERGHPGDIHSGGGRGIRFGRLAYRLLARKTPFTTSNAV